MHDMKTLSVLSLILVPMVVFSQDQPERQQIQFVKKQLDSTFRSEGVAVGDFNKDGKMDIAAGFVWYAAPDWKMFTVLETAPKFKVPGYSNSFCTFAEDFNGDGWTDIAVVDFPGTQTWWFENPQGKPGPWKKHTLTSVTNNESPQLFDIDGDGKNELIAAVAPNTKESDGPNRAMAFMARGKDVTQPWTIHQISEKAAPFTTKYSHGLGIGDINGDGRNDIIVPAGWWQAPLRQKSGKWQFNNANFGKEGATMHVFDIDGDGDNDVLGSSPHKFGVWWYEQTTANQWKTHEIDRTFSQTHAVCLGDINNDGLPDFVTGKRWFAHNGGDPGAKDPAVMHWFELKRENGKAYWIRHQFDHDSGIGTQFEVADVNGDQLLDVVTSNKKGVFYFQQVRK
jgi:hypothetical protein